MVHQAGVGSLHVVLRAYLSDGTRGWVLHSPADIEFTPRDGVQPDLFVAPPVEGRRPREWTEIRRLVLAVEVLSPSTARPEVLDETLSWQPAGAAQPLVIDLQAYFREAWAE